MRYASQVVLVVKNPPANARGIRDAGFVLGSGRSPGEGDATHSSILVWKTPRTEEPGGPHTACGVANSRTQLKRLST